MDARCTSMFFPTSLSQEDSLLSGPAIRREKTGKASESAIMADLMQCRLHVLRGSVCRVEISSLVIRANGFKVHRLQEMRCTCRPQTCGITDLPNNKRVAFSSTVAACSVFEKLTQPRAVRELTPYPSAAIFNQLVMC